MDQRTALKRISEQLGKPASRPWVALLERLAAAEMTNEVVMAPVPTDPAIMGYRLLLAIGVLVPEGGRLRLLEAGRRLLWVAQGNPPEQYAA